MFSLNSIPGKCFHAAGLAALLLALGITFPHAPYASAAESGSLATNTARSATDTNWRQSPNSSLSSAGKQSVTLAACPPGVIAAEPWYFVYISGSGTPEAVRVTGGSCKGDGRPGTLEFTTASSHPSGYVIGSASAGIQEASIAARFTPTSPTGFPQSGKVVIPPGEYDVFAPISIRASGQTVDFTGSILISYTANDACVYVGEHGSSSSYEHITLDSPRGRPMVVNGTKPFIEDNAQQTRIFNVSTRLAPKDAGFGTWVQVDDDQSFLLDGLDSTFGGRSVTCNPTFCGAYVTAPGPFNRWSAVGWLKNLVLSLQCQAKGIEWLSGNGLRISDSIIQGWSVYAVRVSNQRGGYGGLISENVYYEASPTCWDHSPMGNVGSTGILAEGSKVKLSGLAANGASGVFPNWGAHSGSRDWLYWVVPVHAKFGEGVPLPAGHALTDGSSKINGVFPRIDGASSYKILRMDWDQHSVRPYPEGTGKYLIATVQLHTASRLLAGCGRDQRRGRHVVRHLFRSSSSTTSRRARRGSHCQRGSFRSGNGRGGYSYRHGRNPARRRQSRGDPYQCGQFHPRRDHPESRQRIADSRERPQRPAELRQQRPGQRIHSAHHAGRQQLGIDLGRGESPPRRRRKRS
jgi:hypothetical protein